MINKEENIFEKVVKNLRKLDGKQLGKSFRTNGLKLGKNKREAWVNRMVEQYRKGEYVDGKPVDLPPEELEITVKEQIQEMVRDEIKQIFKD